MINDRLLWLILIALGVGLATFLVHLILYESATISWADTGQSLVHNIALLAILIASVVLFWRMRPGHILKLLSIWLVIGIVLVLAYSFRHDVADLARRLVSEVMPSRGLAIDGDVMFRERREGHFVIDANVNGVTVKFLVDTGASDVTLARQDARRLGFDLNNLIYDRTYRTANGIVKGARVRLHSLKVGHIVVPDVRASVNSADMNLSLLGMSFISRLSRFEVADGTLTLRQ